MTPEQRLAAERAYREGWHQSSKAKIKCSTCGGSPFTGRALWRHGEIFLCKEHAPAIEPTVKKRSVKASKS